jgi:hypothetical protein
MFRPTKTYRPPVTASRSRGHPFPPRLERAAPLGTIGTRRLRTPDVDSQHLLARRRSVLTTLRRGWPIGDSLAALTELRSVPPKQADRD